MSYGFGRNSAFNAEQMRMLQKGIGLGALFALFIFLGISFANGSTLTGVTYAAFNIWTFVSVLALVLFVSLAVDFFVYHKTYVIEDIFGGIFVPVFLILVGAVLQLATITGLMNLLITGFTTMIALIVGFFVALEVRGRLGFG